MRATLFKSHKWGALVIGGVLLISLATPVNAAAPKAGATCTKKNATATSAGKLYTCILSGKKLVWNKGVALPKPKPSPSKPTAIADPAGAVGSTPSPTPTPTIERQDWELIYMRIWDELEKSQNQKSFPFEYKLGPTVNKDKAQESIAAYDKAMKIWMPLLAGSAISPVIWTIMSEKDYSWWKQVVDQQEGTSANYAWNPDTDMLGHCKLSSNAFCGYGNTFKSNTPDYKFLQYNVIGSTYNQSPNSNTVNHESVHFYQLSVVQGFPPDIPCWYVEGQASLYGGALQANLVTDRTSSIRQRNNFKGIVRQYQRSADKYVAKDWIDVLKNMYQPHVSCSGQQDYFKYALGTFVWEYLYDKYGPKVMHQVLLDFKAGKSFNESIEKELGLNLDQLNEKLAAHLVHVFADGN
jgi:hypothetical protein